MGKGDGVQSSAPRASFRGLFPLLAAGVLGRIPFVALPIASLLFVADKTSLTRGGLASGAVSFGAGVVGVVVGRALDAGHTKVVLVSLAVAHVPAVAAFIALAEGLSSPRSLRQRDQSCGGGSIGWWRRRPETLCLVSSPTSIGNLTLYCWRDALTRLSRSAFRTRTRR